jgi:two-component system, LuxR family, sensor kinase FixL
LILENLIQNALEATPKGKAVRLMISMERERLAMEVADEGPGMSAEMQTRLFRPCTSSKPGGSGIGLAISHQLANHLGAELSLKHSSAKGCAFRLLLPVPEPSTTGPGQSTSAGKQASRANPTMVAL